MVSSRMSPRLTKLLLFAAVIGLVFWGYQVHLHETVKHLTEEVLSTQMTKLREAFLSEHSKAESGELITGLRNLSIQLQLQQEEKQQQQQQQKELQDKQDELLRQQKEKQRENEEKERQRQLSEQQQRQQQQLEQQQRQKEEQQLQQQIELLNKQEEENKKQQLQQHQQDEQPLKEQQRQLLQENDQRHSQQQQNIPLQQNLQNQQHLQAPEKEDGQGEQLGKEDSKDEEGQQQLQERKEQQQDGKKEEIQRERTSEEEFARRRKRVTDVCSSPHRPPGRIHGVFIHKSGVLYCFVPKAGCTFWKRVFRATRSNDKATKETIFSISRNLVHSQGGKGVAYSPRLFTPQRYPTRLIVTRDPYSRLLSSYLDKVYLPDFWPTEIKPMARRHLTQNQGNRTALNITGANPDFLRKHFNQMAAKFEPNSIYANSSTAFEMNCGKYMTFADFVEEGYNRAEPHWMPIHQICNPCAFNVTHVSHMETFTEDARVVLAQMGLEDVLDNVDDDAQIDEELKTIVEYNFYRAYHDHLQQFYLPCLSKRELAYRLWHNFRWRGYIDPDVEYSVPSFDDEERVQKNLFDQIWLARKSGLANRDRMKRAKNEFKSQAFATVSKRVFERLSDKYAYDFKLFGYDDVRDKLYSVYDKS